MIGQQQLIWLRAYMDPYLRQVRSHPRVSVTLCALLMLASGIGIGRWTVGDGIITPTTHVERVDVVRGIPPVSRSLASIGGTLDAMARLPESQRGGYIEQNWPHLHNGVVYYLRQLGKIESSARVNRVEFRYGSLSQVTAESGDGHRRQGYFADQLVALVYVDRLPQPITVIVECLNGTYVLPEDIQRLQLVGEHTPVERFTIGPREGLLHHVDFPLAIDLAERFELALYRGRSQTASHQITPDQARQLESATGRVQVTVRVVEGDQFDLAAGTFTPSPLRAKRS